MTSELFPGIDLRLWPTRKFKTTTVRLLLRRPLAEQTSANALLPMVLRRGTRRLSDSVQIARALDDLYGAELRLDVLKLAEEHLFIFHLEVVHGDYVPGEDPLPRALHLLRDVVLDPQLRDGLLRADWLQQEQANLARLIQGVRNDKGRYAQLRLIESMFQGEPYAIPRLGRLDQVAEVTEQSLTDCWRDLLAAAPGALYMVGDLDEETARRAIVEAFDGWPARRPRQVSGPLAHPPRERVQSVCDRERVNQGKLALGLTLGCRAPDAGYPAAVLMNGIYGGFSHSKLFQQVRERASLAYYAFSQIDGLKGAMLVHSGIEFQNRARTQQIMLAQLDAMREGRFDQDELDQTMMRVESQIRQSSDSAGEAIMTDYELRLAGRPTQTQARIDALRGVRPDEIAAAAQRVQLDTVYFLDKEVEQRADN